MNKFNHTITVFDANIEDVAVRLGECQHYSDKISERMLLDAGIDSKKDHLNFFELLNLLRKRKALVVSFFGINENNQLHIYSDFFNLDGGFCDAFHFFDDVNSVFMMCEKRNAMFYVSLIKHGKLLLDFTVDIEDKVNIDHNTWSQDYAELYSRISGMPSVDAINISLNSILQNSFKSESQMCRYLNKFSLFKDEYIL